LTGGIIAAIIIAVIVFLLSVPFDFQFRLEVYDKFKFRFRLIWLFGLVKKEFGQRKKERVERKAERGWSFFDFLRIRGLLGGLLRLVKDVIKRVRIKNLAVDFDIGIGDPADTAIFVGGLWLPAYLIELFWSYPVSVRPAFTDDLYLQGYADAAISLRPILIIPALVRFGFSRPGRRLLGMLMFRRWKRKK